ncbi:MAG: restriction endonuclease subunit S [Burkholderiaceae bacterium]|nr:restriction endonuclease subunit S [Burkholderiaceae bacterium]
MKSYPSYKSSEFGLISKIPTHWDENTIKRGFEITLGKMLQSESKQDTDFLAPYLRSANVQSGKVDVSDMQEMWFSPSEAIQLALEPGDLVVCEGGDAGRAAFWNGEIEVCYFQNAVNRVRSCGGNSPKYLMYWMSVIKDGRYLDIICNKATIAHLTKEKLSNLPMLYPPHDEQIAIAGYLDAETTRIDLLIREKHSLLPLLDEAKSSANERATRPPIGGTCNPLSRFTDRISTGPFGSALHSSDYISGGVAVINPTHIVDNNVVPDQEVTVSKEMAEKLGTYRLSENDIVVGRRGEMGRCAVISRDVNWLCGTGCLMITPEIGKVLPEFLQLVISSRASRDWLSLESVGTTMDNLNSEILGRLPCFVPSIQDQLSRLHEAQREIEALDKLCECVKAEIELLKELRSSTITDAVLGRIDVRKAKNN